MKKQLLASIAFAGCCVSAFGQGQVLFQNSDNSSGPWITLYSPTGPQTGSGLVVQLLWYNGSSFVLMDTFTSTFTGTGDLQNGPGIFTAGAVTIPQTGLQTFEVSGSYGFGYTGTTASFVAMVNVSPGPYEGIDTQAGGWNGDLVLTLPEPTTIALSGLGAAVWLLFRRRK